MGNAAGKKTTTYTHILSGWFVPVWGTVLFVLSDPVMHFSLSIYELNHFKAVKSDYQRSVKRLKYLFGWLYQCLYAEVTAKPESVCLRGQPSKMHLLTINRPSLSF